MSGSIQCIAILFYVLGVALALQGIVYVSFDWTRRLRRKLFPAPERTSAPLQNADGLLLLFEGLTQGLNAAGKVGGFVSELLAGILAGIAISAVLLGTLLFFTARGLLHEEPWARWVTGLLMLNLVVFSLLSIATSGRTRPKRFLISLLIAVFSGFGLYTMWQGYGPHA